MLVIFVLAVVSAWAIIADPGDAEPQASSRNLDTTVAHLVGEVRSRAKALENRSGMQNSFQSFTSAYKIAPGTIRYSDFVVVRLLYEATRDAGFWNMPWTITNMPPNSDRVWSQWKEVKIVSSLTPTPLRNAMNFPPFLPFWLSAPGCEASDCSGLIEITR